MSYNMTAPQRMRSEGNLQTLKISTQLDACLFRHMYEKMVTSHHARIILHFHKFVSNSNLDIQANVLFF